MSQILHPWQRWHIKFKTQPSDFCYNWFCFTPGLSSCNRLSFLLYSSRIFDDLINLKDLTKWLNMTFFFFSKSDEYFTEDPLKCGYRSQCRLRAVIQVLKSEIIINKGHSLADEICAWRFLHFLFTRCLRFRPLFYSPLEG